MDPRLNEEMRFVMAKDKPGCLAFEKKYLTLGQFKLDFSQSTSLAFTILMMFLYGQLVPGPCFQGGELPRPDSRDPVSRSRDRRGTGASGRRGHDRSQDGPLALSPENFQVGLSCS